ncbi:MAG: FAD-binding oxidoreductase [Gammaproteobacteria bacterium]|nr:FAD-binding oxidoreductase [Gammaproteobacteria bacterium]
MTSKTVAIVGAGIVGVSAATWLQRDGHKVVLIDNQAPGGASFGNGGVLVPSGIVPVNSPGLMRNAPGMLLQKDSPLFVHWPYLPKMMPWLTGYSFRANAKQARRVASALQPLLHNSLAQHQLLARGSGAEKWIKASDYCFVYDSRKAFKKDAFAWSVRREKGFTWDEMSSSEFEAYDPVFKGTNKFVIRLGEHGRITDPGKYVEDLTTFVQNQGGKLFSNQVQEIIKKDGRVTAVKTRDEAIPCDTVIIAAGAWSKKLSEREGVNIPLETERGYHIDIINSSINPRSAMMITSGKCVITPMSGRIRCAGIVEFGGLSAPANGSAVALLKKRVLQLFPDIEYERIDEWMGHRPAPVDSIPFIGAVGKTQDVYAAFGHHHVGLTAGARTGKLIADLVSGQETGIDMQPYRVDRFTH